MQMLTKFESKSSRVKGVAFHPKRPWILVSLHSSTIQLWDYRMGTLIDRFEEHNGPVRGIDFHPSQPLFVSGGDDYKIKVWSLTPPRKCLFTLSGHLDYVRTVFFHSELPWIVSASDDQTIRIWNWQNRSQLACLTGHTHYCMCAQFHPTEDLIVSASLDQSVRVWDISGLRKKHSAPTNPMSFEDQITRANSSLISASSSNRFGSNPSVGPGGISMQATDIWGNTEAVVKFVLEGHDRGVNWVAFHPTMPLIVSGADDRLVKLWRYSDTKAWEVDSCRGHYSNVTCVTFHPHQDLIISVGEDKTIRTWDLNKRVPVQSFRRENERFWVITAHPTINLFAAGHDAGVMVFKLERERPASVTYQNHLFYVNKEKQVQSFDFNTATSSAPLVSLKQLGAPWVPPRTLSYNPAERSILVTSPADNGVYELITLSRDPGQIEPFDPKIGAGTSALFIARNRFAVFSKSNQTIDIKDLQDVVTKSIKKLPILVNDIAYGGAGNLLLFGKSKVVLFDLQQKKSLADTNAANVKFAVWSPDGQHIAFVGKHTITIANKNLEYQSSLHETIRIKSATWDEAGVLIYSTLNHIKYSLINGDHGVICTLIETVYLTKAKGKVLYALTRAGKVDKLVIDPTEYRFKKALVNKNYSEVLRIIRSSNLVGQSIIAYLQQKGYPDIALQFVQDAQTKFDLALKCGNIQIALEQAKIIDNNQTWKELGQEALSMGNHVVYEIALTKQQDYARASFLYFTTGNVDKLSKMTKVAEQRGDTAFAFQLSLYRDDPIERIRVLKEANLLPLAYATAKSYGLEDIAQQILNESDISESDIKLPKGITFAKGETEEENDGETKPVISKLPIPTPVAETFKENLVLRPPHKNIFESALAGQLDSLSLEAESKSNGDSNVANGFADLIDVDSDEVNSDGNLAFNDRAAGEGASGNDEWDLGSEDDLSFEEELSNIPSSDAAENGGIDVSTSEVDLWVRNSPVAADHVAAGSFETAMQLLNRQIGAVNFEPLKPRFLEIYKASKVYLPANENLPPVLEYNRRNKIDTKPSSLLPFIVRDLATISENDLQAAYELVRGAKFAEAVEAFRQLLYTVTLSAVSNQAEADDVKKLIEICREYILGFSIELERRSLPGDNVKRDLELASYFTRAKLMPTHLQNALQLAMKKAYKQKNFSLASHFATRYLELKNSGPGAETAKKIKAKGDITPHDEIEIDYDQYADFDICAATHTPIYKGQSYVEDPLTGAKYHPSEKGKVDSISKVTQIGAPASGLRLFA